PVRVEVVPSLQSTPPEVAVSAALLLRGYASKLASKLPQMRARTIRIFILGSSGACCDSAAQEPLLKCGGLAFHAALRQLAVRRQVIDYLRQQIRQLLHRFVLRQPGQLRKP